MQKLARIACLIFAAGLLCACAGGTITVENQYPEPIVDPLPYAVGVYMSPAFRTYVYEHEEGKVEFELGSKQTALFTTVLGAMFERMEVLGDVVQGAQGGRFDLILEPVLEEYGYLAPAEMASEFYAVSIKYHVRVYSGDGTLVGYWPMVAYGKNRTGLIDNKASLGDATTMALRDAAAAMVSQFRDVIEKRQWKAPDDRVAGV